MLNYSEDNELYNDVFFINDFKPTETVPSKPPRTCLQEKTQQLRKNPHKSDLKGTESDEDHLDDVLDDLVYLALNSTPNELNHLTKSRAKIQGKRVPERHMKVHVKAPSTSDSTTVTNMNKNLENAIELLKSRREGSLSDFSKVRRTAVKIKNNKKTSM